MGVTRGETRVIDIERAAGMTPEGGNAWVVAKIGVIVFEVARGTIGHIIDDNIEEAPLVVDGVAFDRGLDRHERRLEHDNVADLVIVRRIESDREDEADPIIGNRERATETERMMISACGNFLRGLKEYYLFDVRNFTQPAA